MKKEKPKMKDKDSGSKELKMMKGSKEKGEMKNSEMGKEYDKYKKMKK